MPFSILGRDRRKAYPGNNSLRRVVGRGFTEQQISLTDMISEGPIQGLVRGGASIYLNNDSMFNFDTSAYYSEPGESIKYQSPSNITANAKKGLAENGTTEIGHTLNVSEFGAGFIWKTDSDLGQRFLTIFDIFSMEGSLWSDITKETGWGSSYGYKEAKFNWDASNSTATPNNFPVAANTKTNANRLLGMQTPESSLGSGIDGYRNLITKVTVTGKNDRVVDGMLTEIGANYFIVRFYNSRANFVVNQDKSEIDVSFSQVYEIKTIDTTAKTITIIADPRNSAPYNVDNRPGFDFENKKFNISASRNQAAESKHRSSGYQFRNGNVEQEAITGLYGVGTTSVSIDPPGELHAGVSKTVSFSGAQSSEIDTVLIMFNYPSGLYEIFTGNGDKHNAGAGYVIQGRFYYEYGADALQVDNSTDGRDGKLVTFEGNHAIEAQAASDCNEAMGPNRPFSVVEGQNVFGHGGKHLTDVSFSHEISLEQYQPFVKFDLIITRITNSESMTDKDNGRAHTWGNSSGQNDIHTGQNLAWKSKVANQAMQSGRCNQIFGVVQDKLTYPYTAVANVNFSSQSFDSPPERGYECYGMKVLIPDNYQTREQKGLLANNTFPDVKDLYSGIWTGTFKKNKVYTDNPAWIFYDFISNNRYGLGEFVKSLDINKYSLYKIARYCDELVPDGRGGLEPRFRGNFYFQKATDAYKILKDIATNFRAMLYWMEGELSPVIDEKKTPVYAFNRSNVIDGRFEYQSSGSKTRTNQITVSWNNPDADYKLEPLIIEDRQNILNTGTLVKEEATAFGCTSEGQAIRYGRWKLWTAINQTEVVSFQSSLNSAFLTVGDIITVQDNHDFGVSFSGRVSEAQAGTVSSGQRTQTFTIDREVTTKDGNLFGLTDKQISFLVVDSSVILSQSTSVTIDSVVYNQGDKLPKAYNEAGTLFTFTGSDSDIQKLVNNSYDANGNTISVEYFPETRVITAEINNNWVGITPKDITVTYPESEDAIDLIEKGTIWGIKDNPITKESPKEYKIISIAEEENSVYNFTGIEYYEGKFDTIESNFNLAIPDPLNSQVSEEVPPPTNLRILRIPDFNKNGEEIIVSWDRPTSGLYKEFELEDTTKNPPELVRLDQTSYPIDGVQSGSYVFTVYSVDDIGNRSVPVSAEVIIEDFYEGTHERFKGLLKGGKINSKELIVHDSTTTPGIFTAGLESSSPLFYSPTDTDAISTAITNNTHKTADWYALALKFAENGQPHPWWGPNTDANDPRDYPYASEEAFLAIIGYNTSSPRLRLINFVQDPVLNVDYWYDQTYLNKLKYNENFPNTFFAQGEKNHIWGNGRTNGSHITPTEQGLATSEQGTNKVTLSTSTPLSLTDIIWFFGNMAARITGIEGYDSSNSTQTIFLDRTFNTVSSDISVAQQHSTSAFIDSFNLQGTDSNLNGKTRFTVADASAFQVGDYVRTHSGESTSHQDNSVRFRKYRKILHIFDNEIIVDVAYSTSDAYSGWIAGDRLTTEITNQPFILPELRPDPTADFLLGKLKYTGGTPSFTYESFCNVRTDLTNEKAIIAEANVAFIRYGGETTPIQLSDSGGGPLYQNLTVNITAIGYANPEFNIAGDNSTWTQLTSAPGDGIIPANNTAFVAGSATGVKSFQVDTGAGLIAFGDGTPLEFTVTVRDASDPTNTAKTISNTVLIEKIKDGAIGLDGKTARIVAGDSSILYDNVGTNPKFLDPDGDGFIDFSLFFNGFVAPLYRITLTEGTGSPGTLANYDWREASSADTDSFEFEIPTTFVANTYPKVFKVEVAEKPDGWTTGTAVASSDIKATDVTSVIGQKAGSDGVSISIPNSTHPYNTDKFGNIGSNATEVIPDSGTTIEVLLGGTPAIYVGNSTAVGKPSSTTLQDNQWYFESITNSGADLTIGGISIDSSATPANSVINIGNHTMFNLHSSNTNPTDDREVITYLIRAKINGVETVRKGLQTLSKSIEGIEGSEIVNLHRINNSQSSPGTLPTARYNFTDGTVDQISDSAWTVSAQSPTASNRYLWQISKRVFPPTRTTSTDASQFVTVPDSDSTDSITETWTTPVIIGIFGDVGRNARAIKLIPNFQFMPKDDLTQSGADSTVTCKVDIQPFEDDAGTAIAASNWKVEFLVDKNDGNGFVSKQGPANPTNPYLSSNANEFTLADADEPVGGNDTVLIRVQLTETDDNFASIVAQDTVTITRLSEGISSNLTNYSHIEPANVLGHLTDPLVNGRIAGAGGGFQVFRNGTEISTATENANNSQLTFEVVGGSDGGSYSTKTQGGLEFRIDEITGSYTVRPYNGAVSNWTSDRESFDVKATFSGQDPHAPITYTYVITKSREGLAGASIATSSSTVLFTKLLATLTTLSPSNSGNSTQQVTFDDSISINSAIAFEAGQSESAGAVNVNGSIQSIGTPTINNNTGSKSITVVTQLKDNRSVAQISSDIKIIIKANVTQDGGTAKNLKIPVVVNTGINGEDGSGSNGFRTAEGYVYYNVATASAPSAPTSGGIVTYTWGAANPFVSGGSSTLASGWQLSPPEMKPGQQGQYYYARYSVEEIDSDSDGTPNATSTSGGGGLTFGAATLGHNFTGLVTFHSTSGINGSGAFSDDGGQNFTTIDGGNISTDSIAANKLNIGKTGLSTSRMLLLENSLKIFEGNNLRVHLGDLTNTTE
tara:strand:- start:8326 stop:16332 length:8007 start_codon:yes stop_codon:yes gene_type:complete